MIRRLVAMSFVAFAMPATSQVIERMRLTDNDLSCAQMYGEAQQMEMLVANASRLPAAAPPPPLAPQGTVPPAANPLAGFAFPGRAAVAPQGPGAYNQAAINQAQMQALMARSDRADVRAAANDPAMVAQATAMMQNPQLAVAAQRAAATGVSPAVIQGQLAAAGAAQQAAAAYGASPQQRAVPAIAQLPAPAGGGNANVGAQAQARKEYLTQLFLSRGCRVSDLPR